MRVWMNESWKSKKRSNWISFLYDISKAFSKIKFNKFHSKGFYGEMSVKLYKYPSAVRGYHYYRSYWKPVVGEELDCVHERDNPFDLFAIAIRKTTGETVGHLPMKNSRVTNYLMDRGARLSVVLTSSQYHVSSLVQGGLEIPCEVGICVLLTQKNNELVGIYNNLIQPQIHPRPESFMIGSFLQTSTEVSTPLTSNKPKKKSTLEKNRIYNQKDIRIFFSARSQPDLHLEETTVIEIVNNRITFSLVLYHYLCFLIPIWKVTFFSGNSLHQGVPYFLVQVWYKCQFFFFFYLCCVKQFATFKKEYHFKK